MESRIKASNTYNLSAYWPFVLAVSLFGGAVIYQVRDWPAFDIFAALCLFIGGPLGLVLVLSGASFRAPDSLRARRGVVSRFVSRAMEDPAWVIAVFFVGLGVAVGIDRDLPLRSWLSIATVLSGAVAIGAGYNVFADVEDDCRPLEASTGTPLVRVVRRYGLFAVSVVVLAMLLIFGQGI